jgi:hypothetical protein
MSYNTPLVQVHGSSLAGDFSQAGNNFFNAKNQADDRDLRKQQLAGAQNQQEVENAQKQGEFDLKKQKAEGEKQNQGLIQQATSALTNPSASLAQKNQAVGTLGQLAPETLKAIQGHLGAQEGKMEQAQAKMIYSTAGDLRNTPYAERQAKIDNVIKTLPPNSPLQAQLLSLKEQPEEQQNISLSSAQKSVLPLAEQAKLDNPEKTTIEKQLLAANIDPKSPEGQQIVKDSITKPQTQVNLNGKNESEQAKGFGKAQATRYEDISKKADNAAVLLGQADTLLAINPKTGALEPSKAKISNFLASAGLTDLAKKVANGSEAEAVKAISTALTIGKLKENVGVQTDFDFKKAEETIAALGDTPAGFQFKVATLKAVAIRQIQQRDFIDQKVAEQTEAGGSPDLGKAMKEWRDHIKDTPNISRNIKNKEGLPVYYYQFQENAKNKYPDISDDEITQQWNQVNARK